MTAGLMQDASLDAAAKILSESLSDDDLEFGVDANDEFRRKDAREDRTDRDPTERLRSGDLEEAEREERDATDEAEGEDAGEDADTTKADEAETEDFIELPAEEGKEPVRIPAREAAEAWQKLKSMDGDIATALIRVEEEAIQKQDKITQQLSATFETVAQQARAAAQMMLKYAPPQPDPRDYATTEEYDYALRYHQAYWQDYQRALDTEKQGRNGTAAVATQQDTELVRRETERAARYIPEFKDEKAREARKSEILDVLSKRYGVSKDELDDIVDHKAWRMMNDLVSMVATAKKAPEVRQAVRERAPKLRKGNASQARDPSTQRFTSQTRKALKETGSIEAAAAHFLRSGLAD